LIYLAQQQIARLETRDGGADGRYLAGGLQDTWTPRGVHEALAHQPQDFAAVAAARALILVDVDLVEESGE
jgi:hypothetical protein